MDVFRFQQKTAREFQAMMDGHKLFTALQVIRKYTSIAQPFDHDDGNSFA